MNYGNAESDVYQRVQYIVTLSFPYPKEPARTPQADNLRSQLAKLGNTPFEVAGHLSEEASGIDVYKRQVRGDVDVFGVEFP